MNTGNNSNCYKIVLSFFADVGLWDNLGQIIAYPTGMSYFRPFRYRDEWIDKQIRENFVKEEGRKEFIGQEVLIAARFSTEGFDTIIIPIRSAKITHIDFVPDSINVYFKLGYFYLLDFQDNLYKQSLQFAKQANTPTKNFLFFMGEFNSIPTFWDKDEDEAWIKWTTAIAKDVSLPFNEKARRLVFVRIRTLREKNLLDIEQIHSSWLKGPIYGFLGNESKSYELVYLHRVPFLFGFNEPVPKFKIKLATSTPHWEFSRIDEEVSANYQVHEVTMTSLEPSAAYEEVLLEPNIEELSGANGKLYTMKSKFFVKIEKNLFYRLRSRYLWLVLLGLCIILNSILPAYWKNEEIKPEIIIGMLSFLILVLGNMVAEKGLLK